MRFKMKNPWKLAVQFAFASLLTQGAMASTIQLPKTGMTACYNDSGTSVTCTSSNQDGDLQKGIAWPTTRFTDQGSSVVDNLTGLIWSKEARTPGPAQCSNGSDKTWSAALTHVACLNTNSYLGFVDWRLPNINELKSLADLSRTSPALTPGHPFTNVLDQVTNQNRYWSSTTMASLPASALDVDMKSGVTGSTAKSGTLPVWPVRGGSGGVIQLPKTGQTSCYDAQNLTTACQGSGQDGELQKGMVWPNPRFANNITTLTDNLTGLVWPSKDVLSNETPPACNILNLKLGWTESITTINCLNQQNYLGSNDWRLPNYNELASLINREESSTVAWLSPDQGFQSFLADAYWTSTPNLSDPATLSARAVDMETGADFAFSQAGLRFIPVRAGNYVPSTLLTLSFSGTGSGSVNSNQLGLSCHSSDPYCQPALYPTGTTVVLTASASGSSGFDGWSGCNSTNGLSCSVTMNTSKTVNARFTPLPPSPPRAVNPRISVVQGYQTIQAGLNAALSNDIIKAVASASQTPFTEDLTVSAGNLGSYKISLLGGHDSVFQTNIGLTTIQGKLTIQSGTLIVDRIAIR